MAKGVGVVGMPLDFNLCPVSPVHLVLANGPDAVCDGKVLEVRSRRWDFPPNVTYSRIDMLEAQYHNWCKRVVTEQKTMSICIQ